MLQSSSWLLTQLLLFVVTAAVTHLVVSLGQTLMHYKLGHHPIGGRLFHNHINFHHTFYSKDHLVSQTYLGEGEGNNTPFFFIPVFLVGGCAYFLLPITFFAVMVVCFNWRPTWVLQFKALNKNGLTDTSIFPSVVCFT